MSIKDICSRRDLENLVEFLGLNERGKGRDVQMYLRLRNLGLKSNLKLPIGISFLPLYFKYLISDLDFGPVDRLIRKFRKKIVLNYIQSQKDYTLLDAGCGRQATLGWNIKSICKQYIGVDKDIPPVSVSNLTFIKGAIEDVLPTIAQDSIDIITALAVIEHLEAPAEFLQECLRALKPNGLIILTTPPPVSAPVLSLISKIGLINGDEIEEHKIYFNLKSLKRLLESAGLEVMEAKTFMFGFNLFVVGKKL